MKRGRPLGRPRGSSTGLSRRNAPDRAALGAARGRATDADASWRPGSRRTAIRRCGRVRRGPSGRPIRRNQRSRCEVEGRLGARSVSQAGRIEEQRLRRTHARHCGATYPAVACREHCGILRMYRLRVGSIDHGKTERCSASSSLDIGCWPPPLSSRRILLQAKLPSYAILDSARRVFIKT